METSRKDLEGWFDEGKKKGARHMIVLCDTFDWTDYPVYTRTDDDCLLQYRNPGKRQKVMEVYDLSVSKDEQLRERRVMRLPVK